MYMYPRTAVGVITYSYKQAIHAPRYHLIGLRTALTRPPKDHNADQGGRRTKGAFERKLLRRERIEALRIHSYVLRSVRFEV